jgi:DNA helicase-2/ATP-dependent DNA helicase PcrA
MENKREIICRVLCKKEKCNPDLSVCNGRQNRRCKQLEKSFIYNMNEGQTDYVTSKLRQNTFLKACPGSGKTEVLAIKVAYEREQWKLKTQGFAVLTFTNSAEKEINSRLDCYLNGKLEYPHYMGTFTSWLHGYIANPFLHKWMKYDGDERGDKSIRLVESSCTSDFLNAYSSKYQYKELGYIKAHEFFRDFKTDSYQYCGIRNRQGKEILQSLVQQDDWRELDLENTKLKFWKSGFALYEDIEYMSNLLFEKYPEIAELIAKRFPVIFVDECQDLSYVQLELLATLCEKGCKIHLIGDLNQAIYRFRNIEPDDTKEFIEHYCFETKLLKENYRSCQSIVDASEYVVSGKNEIVGRNINKARIPLVAILYSKGKEKLAINRFHEYVLENNLSTRESRIIVRNNNLKNKLLGMKSNSQSPNNLETVAQIVYLLNRENLISDFKMQFDMLAKSIQKIFFKTSEHLNSQFLYRPKEIGSKEWKKLLFEVRDILKKSEQLNDFSVTWTAWKKNLNKLMTENIKVLPELSGCTYDIGIIRKGNKDQIVEKTLFDNEEGDLIYAIETIHGCKGMSLDAVFFLSSYQASGDEHSGGYWKQWFDRAHIGEENRLAYVAFSRARYFLALGIPKPKNFSDIEIKMLENAGFEVVES